MWKSKSEWRDEKEGNRDVGGRKSKRGRRQTFGEKHAGGKLMNKEEKACLFAIEKEVGKKMQKYI